MRRRIAIIISHPIQHFCPQYVSYDSIPNVELKVFFASSLGHKAYYDANFNSEITWSRLYLDQFAHVFLNDGKVARSSAQLDAPELDDALEEFMPDILITNGYFQKYQRRAYNWAIRNKKTILYISDAELRQIRQSWKYVLKFPFLFYYFRKIDFFMSVGDSNEDYYRRYGVPSGKMIRTCFPIDIKVYATAFDNRSTFNDSVRSKYGISKTDKILLTVGKLVNWKSQEHVIESLIELEKRSQTNFIYLLAGDGPDLKRLKEKAEKLKLNRVIFCGFINPEELPALYAAADIYVHPSKIEPHSLAISEAIYMGCPIILSNRCGSYGIGDDVCPQTNGLVYTWGDIGSLTNEIHHLSNNTALLRQYSVASHSRAVTFQELAHGKGLSQILAQIEK